MATMLHYDEKITIEKLDRMGRRLRAAFAACCAERQLPAYVSFFRQTGRGEPAALREILEQVWRALEGTEIAVRDLEDQIERCMSLIPKEDDRPWVEEQPYAEDAASAIAYALRTIQSGKSQEAAWAGHTAYESIDYYVTNHIGVEGSAHVLAHPLVQAELARQHRDLDDLLSAAERSERSSVIVTELHARAQEEAAKFFGKPN